MISRNFKILKFRLRSSAHLNFYASSIHSAIERSAKGYASTEGRTCCLGETAQLVLAPFQALLFSLRSCLCKCWLTPGRMGGRIPRLVLHLRYHGMV